MIWDVKRVKSVEILQCFINVPGFGQAASLGRMIFTSGTDNENLHRMKICSDLPRFGWSPQHIASKMVQILVRQMADVRCNDVCHGIPWCVQNLQTVVQIQRRVDWGISVHQDALRTPETLTLTIVHTHFFSLSPGKIDWLSPIV